MSTQHNKPTWHFNNTYLQLPEGFYSQLFPVAVASPSLYLFNNALAQQLGLPPETDTGRQWAMELSGNQIPDGAQPLAQAYAGHQFGHFTMLGDGRAILLGEHLTPSGLRFDIQLKGSGITPYSRRGDGRATLSAMLREYLMSEAMYYLGIPTSRSLAVVCTGEEVARDRMHPGAVLTRVAASHIRVGTFEYASRFMPETGLKALLEYTIDRHYPELKEADNKAMALLRAVMLRQIELIVHWMRVGFIHGVMNTDNMSIAGETIDYGPCAFMNAYHPATVFSSIDSQGRYAYNNQPNIARWNLACLAGALLPLIDTDSQKAAQMAKEELSTFGEYFKERWLTMMRSKLGLFSTQPEDAAMVEQLMQWMAENEADYTNTFLTLQNSIEEGTALPLLYNQSGFEKWYTPWRHRLETQNGGAKAALELMQKNNPQVIPRNHLVEEALEAASFDDDPDPLHQLLEVLRSPYSKPVIPLMYTQPPADGDRNYMTFCGT
jgi:uncharacterized protein YdiU (UPF0061 family)